MLDTEEERKRKQREYVTAWRARNPQKVKEYDAKTYARNRAKCLARSAAYKATHPEASKKAQAKRDMNPEKERARRADFYAINKDSQKEKSAKYYAKNLEYCKKRDAAYRAKNYARIMARKAAWRKANWQKIRAYDAIRLAAKKAGKIPKPKTPRKYSARQSAYNHVKRARRCGVVIGDLEVIRVWETKWRKSKRVRCYWCRGFFQGSACCLDHIVSFKNGGPHSIENLCIACGPCNYGKQAKPLELWNEQIENPTLF